MEQQRTEQQHWDVLSYLFKTRARWVSAKVIRLHFRISCVTFHLYHNCMRNLSRTTNTRTQSVWKRILCLKSALVSEYHCLLFARQVHYILFSLTAVLDHFALGWKHDQAWNAGCKYQLKLHSKLRFNGQHVLLMCQHLLCILSHHWFLFK